MFFANVALLSRKFLGEFKMDPSRRCTLGKCVGPQSILGSFVTFWHKVFSNFLLQTLPTITGTFSSGLLGTTSN